VFSGEGKRLRGRLTSNILRLREAMNSKGLRVTGTPSPIEPVFVGEERVARSTAKHLRERSLLANLVEFPAVPRGQARFRFQVMGTHTEVAIDGAAGIMADCRAMALGAWGCGSSQAMLAG
jgi:7-keto-8-aminopelargonate synthetase-like enzyme